MSKWQKTPIVSFVFICIKVYECEILANYHILQGSTSCFSGSSFRSCFRDSTSNFEQSPFCTIDTNSSFELFVSENQIILNISSQHHKHTLTNQKPLILPLKLLQKDIQVQILLGVNEGNLRNRRKFFSVYLWLIHQWCYTTGPMKSV